MLGYVYRLPPTLGRALPTFLLAAGLGALAVLAAAAAAGYTRAGGGEEEAGETEAAAVR